MKRLLLKLYQISTNLPSFVWVFLLPLGLILFIVTIISFFMALASVEGFASVIMLLVGFGVLWASSTEYVSKNVKTKSSGLFVAFGISFFALMGLAIDQPGNFIYNKPIEVFFCPDGTNLKRNSIVSHPLPGRTDVNQNFECYESDESVKTIGIFDIMLVRFVEYVFIGYGLVYLVAFLKYRNINKPKVQKSSSPISR